MGGRPGRHRTTVWGLDPGPARKQQPAPSPDDGQSGVRWNGKHFGDGTMIPMARRRDPLAQTRSLLYALARLLGDVQAVRKGPRAVARRIARRAAGRAAGRLLGRLFR